jgi:hypothetical protein
MKLKVSVLPAVFPMIVMLAADPGRSGPFSFFSCIFKV